MIIIIIMMPQTVQLTKLGRVQKISIIVDHKPLKEPRKGTCYIRLMHQDHKPPIYLLNPFRIRNRPIQWTTTMEYITFYTLWTKHCKYCSEIHTLHVSQSSFRTHGIFWKSKIEIQKSELWAICHWLFDITLTLPKSKF